MINKLDRELKSRIRKQTQTPRKEIGDRVVITDYSSLTTLGNNWCGYEFEYLDNIYLIVTNVNQKRIYAGTHVYIQDLIIADPTTKKLYRVSSQHVDFK